MATLMVTKDDILKDIEGFNDRIRGMHGRNYLLVKTPGVNPVNFKPLSWVKHADKDELFILQSSRAKLQTRPNKDLTEVNTQKLLRF
jgi:hypothetical protein